MLRLGLDTAVAGGDRSRKQTEQVNCHSHGAAGFRGIGMGPSNSSEDYRRPEDAARAALEAIGGGPLSDEDWPRVRIHLIEFANLLRSWELGIRRDPRCLIRPC